MMKKSDFDKVEYNLENDSFTGCKRVWIATSEDDWDVDWDFWDYTREEREALPA